MSPVRRFGPLLTFAAAILVFSGPWASAERTGSLAEPWLTALGLSPEAADLAHRILRKLGHFAAYGAFAWVAFRALRGDGPASPRNAARAWTLALALAVADESLQWFAPGRGGSPWDVLIDGAGAAVVLCVLLWRLLRARKLGRVPATTGGGTSPGR